MKWGDSVLRFVALGGLIAFLVTIAWFVPAPELILIFALVVLFAIYDFWIHARRHH